MRPRWNSPTPTNALYPGPTWRAKQTSGIVAKHLPAQGVPIIFWKRIHFLLVHFPSRFTSPSISSIIRISLERSILNIEFDVRYSSAEENLLKDRASWWSVWKIPTVISFGFYFLGAKFSNVAQGKFLEFFKHLARNSRGTLFLSSMRAQKRAACSTTRPSCRLRNQTQA